MDEIPRSASRKGSIDDKIFPSPTWKHILEGAAAVTATIIPVCEGYFHARSGMPSYPSVVHASLAGLFLGTLIETWGMHERAPRIISEGYRIFRWPIGVGAMYWGMYHVGYFVGGLFKN